MQVVNQGVIRGDVMLPSGADIFNGRGGVMKGGIFGGDGNDTLTGGGSNDEIHGQGGQDALSGRSGDDMLFGGALGDTLKGGGDADDFVFKRISDSQGGSANHARHYPRLRRFRRRPARLPPARRQDRRRESNSPFRTSISRNLRRPRKRSHDKAGLFRETPAILSRPAFARRPNRFSPDHRGACGWQGQRDSNPRPTVLETVALPAELYP